MDELHTLVRLCRPRTREERVTVRTSANAIRKQLHFAEQQRVRLAAEAILLLNGVPETKFQSRK
jgi:hypothetical protein